MNEEDLELLLYRILSGKTVFTYRHETYELRSPSHELRYHAQIIYQDILNDEKYNDWIKAENLENLLISIGLWSKDTPTMIKNLEKKIDKTKVDMYLSATLKEKVKSFRKILNSNRDSLNNILSKKHEMFNNTLEGYAASIKNEYIICNTLYKNNEKVFDSVMNNQLSYVLFNNLVTEINKKIITMELFKKLALSGMWRSYWNCNKTHVFPNSVCEWTEDQRVLVGISKMYDSVYEHPECPDDSVVEDEDMLDGWMLHQKEKIKKAKKISDIDNMDPKLKGAQEVFLFANKQEEIEDIINLNSPESLFKMKQKFAAINNAGHISDLALPDVQMDLLQQRSEILKSKG
jgi:hypothetical protein